MAGPGLPLCYKGVALKISTVEGVSLKCEDDAVELSLTGFTGKIVVNRHKEEAGESQDMSDMGIESLDFLASEMLQQDDIGTPMRTVLPSPLSPAVSLSTPSASGSLTGENSPNLRLTQSHDEAKERKKGKSKTTASLNAKTGNGGISDSKRPAEAAPMAEMQSEVTGKGASQKKSKPSIKALSPTVSPTKPSPPSSTGSSGSRAIIPPGRWGHTGTLMSEEIVCVYGGQADDDLGCATLGDAYFFDLATHSWSKPVNTDSIPRVWHTACFMEDLGLLVSYGGERMVGETLEVIGDVMVFDSAIQLHYPIVVSGKAPQNRAGHSASVLGSKMVVFGGCNGRRWCAPNVALLDTSHWRWSQAKTEGNPLEKRSYHSATTLKDKDCIVIFGGNNEKKTFNDVGVLRASSGSSATWNWSHPVIMGHRPAPRTGHMAVLLGDGKTIFICGGWDPDPDDGTGIRYFFDSYLLDTELWEWREGPAIGTKASAHVGGQAVLVPRKEGTVVLFGGQDQHGVRRCEVEFVNALA